MLSISSSTLFLLLIGLNAVTASSTRSPPLHASDLSHATFLSVQVLPKLQPRRHKVDIESRRSSPIPQWDDNLYLSFTSHGNNITLSLRPSTNIIRPDGINSLEEHVNEKGIKSSVNKKIGRDEFKIYEGFVLDDSVDRKQWTREEMAGLEREATLDSNWARIVLLNVNDEDVMNDLEDGIDGEGLRFQGTYSIDSETYTIHSTPNYLRTRQFLDPDPPIIQKRSTLSHPSMIIVKDRHTISLGQHIEELQKRGLIIPETLIADNATLGSSCGYDDLSFNYDHSFSMDANSPTTGKRVKRQGGSSGNYIDSIGSTAGCPQTRKVILMGVAADCAFVRRYGSIENARAQLLTDFNSASSVFSSTFNISLGIIHLNIQSGVCPASVDAVDPANPWNVDCAETGPPGLLLNERLSVFSEWRATTPSDGAGLWHLVSGCNSGREIGVAWTSQVCSTNARRVGDQIASGTAVSTLTVATWIVIVHEIAHNFGALHDCIQGCSLGRNFPSCCPLSTNTCDSQFNFIMSPFSNGPVNSFSSCSIGNVCTALRETLDSSCLADPGETQNRLLISEQNCGNGIVEEGEDCDPGNLSDPCCNASTCSFVPSATCSPLNSNCCTSQCQLASSGTICRESLDPMCDIAQRCDGESLICPERCFVVDSNPCGDNLACASGRCTNLDQQCAAVGSAFGITEGCPVTPPPQLLCNIVCAAGNNRCTVFDQIVRDGTPCGDGGAGLCYNNVCEFSRMQPQAMSKLKRGGTTFELKSNLIELIY